MKKLFNYFRKSAWADIAFQRQGYEMVLIQMRVSLYDNEKEFRTVKTHISAICDEKQELIDTAKHIAQLNGNGKIL